MKSGCARHYFGCVQLSLNKLSELVLRDPQTLKQRFGTVGALVLRSTEVPGGADLSLEDTQEDGGVAQWAELYRGDSVVIPLIKGKTNPFAGVVTLGRRKNNDIVLADPKVSKLHALFRRGQFGWLLEDKSARNGTLVNGRRLEAGEEVDLGVGDELRFGDSGGVFADVGLLETLCSYVRARS